VKSCKRIYQPHSQTSTWHIQNHLLIKSRTHCPFWPYDLILTKNSHPKSWNYLFGSLQQPSSEIIGFIQVVFVILFINSGTCNYEMQLLLASHNNQSDWNWGLISQEREKMKVSLLYTWKREKYWSFSMLLELISESNFIAVTRLDAP